MVRALLLLFTLTGCASRHAQPPWVVALRVEGPDPAGEPTFGDPDLPALAGGDGAVGARRTAWAAREQAVRQPWSRWWQFLPLAGWIEPRPSLNPSGLHLDAARLERWFAARGYRQATVDVQVLPARRRPQDRREVVFQVDPGPRTTWAEVVLQVDDPAWASRLSALAPAPGPAEQARLDAAVAAIQAALAQRGLARAQIEVRPVPLGGDRERLELDVEVGASLCYGEVTWVGLARLERPGRWLARALPEGAPWAGAEVERARRRLLQQVGLMGAEILAGDLDPRGCAEVLVVLEEEPAWRVDPGLGLGASGATFSLAGGASVSGRHLGGRPLAFDGWAEVGGRVIPTTAATPGLFSGNHGPVGETDLRLSAPLLPQARLSWQARSTGLLDVRQGYHQLAGSASLGVGWRTDPLLLVVEGVLAGDRTWATPLQEPVFLQAFDPTATDPALGDPTRLLPVTTLVHPRLRLEFDSLDRRFDPQQGWLLRASGVPWGAAGSARFRQARLDATSFVRLVPDRATLLLRLAGGWVDWDRPEAPRILSLREHLGGWTDLQAWAWRRLGPPGGDFGPDGVRAGGNVLMLGTLQPRVRLHPHLLVFPFFSVGRTWLRAEPITLPDGRVQPGVNPADLVGDLGAGCDVPSPLGVLRTTLAWQPWAPTGLTDPPQRWNWQLVLDAEL